MAGVSARVDLVEPAAAPLLARRFFAEAGETSPIVRALAQVPELVAPTLEFVGVVLGATSLDLRTKELVILRVSALAGCTYCVGAHRVAAAASASAGRGGRALRRRARRPARSPATTRSCSRVADAVAARRRGARRDDRATSAATAATTSPSRSCCVASATLMLNRFCTALGLPSTAATAARLAELEDAP